MTTLTYAEATKAIRKDLKKCFPGFEFRIKKALNFSTRRYSADQIDIIWFGGPSLEEVEAITEKYYDTEDTHMTRHRGGCGY